jgi:hypothetical protein
MKKTPENLAEFMHNLIDLPKNYPEKTGWRT